MQRVITLLSVAAFWLHFVVGSCACHAEADDSRCSLETRFCHELSHAGHDHTDHEHDVTHDESEKGSGRDHPHCDGHEHHSHFVAIGYTAFSPDLSCVAFLATWPAEVSLFAGGVNFVGEAGTREAFALPVRLHAWHTVWHN